MHLHFLALFLSCAFAAPLPAFDDASWNSYPHQTVTTNQDSEKVDQLWAKHVEPVLARMPRPAHRLSKEELMAIINQESDEDDFVHFEPTHETNSQLDRFASAPYHEPNSKLHVFVRHEPNSKLYVSAPHQEPNSKLDELMKAIEQEEEASPTIAALGTETPFQRPASHKHVGIDDLVRAAKYDLDEDISSDDDDVLPMAPSVAQELRSLYSFNRDSAASVSGIDESSATEDSTSDEDFDPRQLTKRPIAKRRKTAGIPIPPLLKKYSHMETSGGVVSRSVLQCPECDKIFYGKGQGYRNHFVARHLH